MGGRRTRAGSALFLTALLLASRPDAAAAQIGGVDLDTVRAGRFDDGRMWPFEYAPAEWFREAYGVTADAAWFERARLSALRIPGCSASFVSPNGLVATNHHCVRGAVSRVSREGEGLLDRGFYAPALEVERRIPDFHADQLVAIEEVSEEMLRALDGAVEGEARERAQVETRAAIETRLRSRHGAAGDSVWVQVVPLYHGGRYSAYVFRRFNDVRLVAAAELQVGFFGGDPDNFTYPRYALDFAFLRVYEDGVPHRPRHHFGWSEAGVSGGDAVFVIGNPGPTNRLMTVAQLEYQRDVQVPALAAWLEATHAALGEYRAEDPAAAEALDIRNRMFSLSNSLKASEGRLAALRDEVILARRRDAERRLRGAIRADAELRSRYDSVFDALAALQTRKSALARPHAAFLQLTNRTFASAVLARALAAHHYLAARSANAPEDTLAILRAELARIGDHPPSLERRLLAARFADFRRWLGGAHPVTAAALGGREPGEAARRLLAETALRDSAGTAALLAREGWSPEDPALRLAGTLAPAWAEYLRESGRIAERESRLTAELGRVRFAVYGKSVPPDGTFSPRITDGVVRGYSYNGTLAPPYTTFYGLYDRWASHGEGTDWELPGRWRTPPAGLDLATPLNFVSTADTYGGNSGSPAVTRELDLVGLNFDRNIEGLSRDFIYLPERGRNVMVDVRAIRAALDHVYDADRIVEELATGRLFRSEEEADAVRAASR